ncbi:MAG: type I-U CRISPR-associated protein Cas7 [Verrucomicrobia bacterium]|nr:type I-U CRISPR-associated protein Cas7 [Verrucomicrobiota bacterium]MBI3868371.1 type I-U CRISPR-associated protein Cas7 [Verrucomicrobiota bacterium]
MKLDLATLQQAVNGSAAAFRCRRKLQPAGGAGDKVFPPTFAGAVYAVEQRRVRDQEGNPRPDPVTCVVLDTVQSQANRMEQALQDALDSGRIKIPVLKVDFSDWSPTGKLETEKFVDDVGVITSLQLPHRLADAILRDSEIEEEVAGKREKLPFRKSRKGRQLDTVSQRNATALYQLCPTALIFGMWDSTGPKGGLGAKFERAMVSEVIGVGATFGVKTASRIDPIITKTEGIEIFKCQDGGWTLDKSAAETDANGKAIHLGKGEKRGKVSNANLGNVLPTFAQYTKGANGPDILKVQQLSGAGFNLLLDNPDTLKQLEARKGQMAAGGASIEYAEQLTTLSLIVLRRLCLPVSKRGEEKAEDFAKRKADAERAGRVVLAALGLCAATLAFESGLALRSRCLLWPEEALTWELLDQPGAEKQPRFSITGKDTVLLLEQSVAAASALGLEWEDNPIELLPSPELVKLVRKSQELMQGGAEEEAD